MVRTQLSVSAAKPGAEFTVTTVEWWEKPARLERINPASSVSGAFFGRIENVVWLVDDPAIVGGTTETKVEP